MTAADLRVAPAPATTGARRPARLVGVDAARGLALLAMMATHVLPDVEPTTSNGSGLHETWPFVIAAGRASALFAVLAGVGLALAHGGEQPPSGRALSASRRAVLARAAFIAVVGLTLGLRPGNVAVILVNYGVLFAVASLALALRARTLALIGGPWLVLAPIASHFLRSHLPEASYVVTSWRSLAHPLHMVSELLFTGYYPALTWTGYVLVGMAVGRAGLARRSLALALAVGGAALAVASIAVSGVLVRSFGGSWALLATAPDSFPVGYSGAQGRGMAGVIIATQMYGVTPTTTWHWLAIDAAHSGTPFDLLATAGSALAVLGTALLVARAGTWGARAGVPLAAAGSMTLTLYCLHVLAIPPMIAVMSAWHTWIVQAIAVVLVALAVRATARRGPLEQVAAVLSRLAARGRVQGRAPAGTGAG